MKISIVVPVFNDMRVGRALESILSQQHEHELEIIVVDAGSTDGTLAVLEAYRDRITILISEPDKGIFDGVNKGIARTSGASHDVVHFMSADDQYVDPFVIRAVMDVFQSEEDIDACYGDQIYMNEAGKTVRYWKAGNYRRAKIHFGWLPPHMAFFVRKRIYEHHGMFNLRYPIAADQDFMLRLLYKHRIKVRYLRRILVNMAPGGNATKNILRIFKANLEVARICWNDGLPGLLLFPVLKPARKVFQFISRP